MPDERKYDLSYRPESYWNTEAPALTASGVNPTGKELETRYPGEVTVVWLQLASTLGDWVHLRARRDGDIIRFRIVDEGDDEAMRGDEDLHPRDTPGIMESHQPLTFGEVVESLHHTVFSDPHTQINYAGAGLVAACRGGAGESPYRDDRERARGFVRVYSDFYPELQRYYEEDEQEWIDAGIERPPGLEFHDPDAR